MTQAQQFASDLEGQVAELKVQNQQATKELAKANDERDATTDKLAKLEVLVAELRDRETRSKKLAVQEFKSSDDFQEAIETTTSRYFGEGFDFYKWQLCRHYPDLNIDLEGMGIDHDLLEKEEDEMEEKEERKDEKEEEKDDNQNIDPFSPQSLTSFSFPCNGEL